MGEGECWRTDTHRQLPLDEVGPGDHFSDRVLDLQARVHLHEVKVLLVVHDELDRSCDGTRHRMRAGRGVAGGEAALGGWREERGAAGTGRPYQRRRS